MCEGAFTPTDDQGCVIGCQQCPENDISDTCRQLIDQYGLKIIQNLFLHSGNLFWIGCAIIKEFLFVKLGNGSHLSNLFIHHWLRKTWLIKLIVTIFTISNQVNNDVMVELLSVLCRHFKAMMNVFGRICIYMENWSVYAFSQI